MSGSNDILKTNLSVIKLHEMFASNSFTLEGKPIWSSMKKSSLKLCKASTKRQIPETFKVYFPPRERELEVRGVMDVTPTNPRKIACPVIIHMKPLCFQKKFSLYQESNSIIISKDMKS